ncbi:MAG TPA: histidine kinase dimerization/phospho-acceptor domain-containing protein, partial [Rhodothermales bacterium]|nr:histidine kinase dimerization/phospho-acceptor domain-containing protein [Rhodothermales bacterium]
MPFSNRHKHTPLAQNRLSLRIALLAAVFSAASVLISRLASIHVSLVGALAWSVVLGLFTYAITHIILARRLELARTMLQQIQRRRFEKLHAVQPSRPDELDALIMRLYRAGRSVEKEVTELRQAENYRREFLGNVSHELKTPIFAIQGFAETLLGGALDDERVNRTFLEKILHNTNRLDALSRD